MDSSSHAGVRLVSFPLLYLTTDHVYLGKKGKRVDKLSPAAIQSDKPIPAGTPFHYFELTILKGPVRNNNRAVDEQPGKECEVRIGLAERYSTNTQLPGECFDSFGYSNGCYYEGGSPQPQILCPGRRFYQDDVVGCGVIVGSGKVFFTYNGQVDTPLMDCLPVRLHYPLYAKLGLRGDVRVRANFGDRDFAFDVADFLKVLTCLYIGEVTKFENFRPTQSLPPSYCRLEHRLPHLQTLPN